MKLLLFIIISYQTTSYLVEATIFRWLRNIPIIGELFKCMLCTGFWVGLFYARFCNPFDQYDLNYYLSLIFGAIFYSFMTWQMHLIESNIYE